MQMLTQGIMMWWCECRRRGRYNPGSREVFLQEVTSLQGQFMGEKWRGMKNGPSRRKHVPKGQRPEKSRQAVSLNVYPLWPELKCKVSSPKKWGCWEKPEPSNKG